VLPTLLSLPEFEELVENLEPDITEDQVLQFFDQADTNDDGFITEFEIEAELERQPTQPPVSSSRSKSDKGSRCAMIKGKKAKRKCMKNQEIFN